MIPNLTQLNSPKDEFTGLLTLDTNIVLYENEKFAKTDSQLPIDSDPRASLIALWLLIAVYNLHEKRTIFFHKTKILSFKIFLWVFFFNSKE